MIVGVGVDVVDVARLGRSLERTPALLDRLFTPAEQQLERLESLAARFAAKEAVAKALGNSGLSFLDAEVVSDEQGKPSIVLHGDAIPVAEALGINRWHVSLTHDAGQATAFVVAESA
jgi:holo-[acyl-carrier protein] synthase